MRVVANVWTVRRTWTVPRDNIARKVYVSLAEPNVKMTQTVWTKSKPTVQALEGADQA